MKKSKFTEQQIAFAIKQGETKSKNSPGLYKDRVVVQSQYHGINLQDVPYS